MSQQAATCRSLTVRGKPCRMVPAEGSLCRHHERQAQCLAWTPDGPCESTETSRTGYCPKHENTP